MRRTIAARAHGMHPVAISATSSDRCASVALASRSFPNDLQPDRSRPASCYVHPVVTPNPERRVHRRTSLDGPVLLETSQRTATVRSLDVSGGGMKLRSSLGVNVRDRVTVYFELPIGFGIEACAEVRRYEGDVIALRFLGLPRESELAIRSFCRISGLRPAAREGAPVSAPPSR
ncbi:MAG: PilZ domain-containing protein [Polyangiaceae bacterium]